MDVFRSAFEGRLRFAEHAEAVDISRVLSPQNEMRTEPSMTAGGRCIASSTWLRCPLQQAEPAET